MNRIFFYTKRSLLIFLFILIAGGCMTEQVAPNVEYPGVPKQSTFLIKKIEYDAHGRPLFNVVTRDRPHKAGKFFTIVHAVNNKPVRSYDIAIVERQKADVSRPLTVVYEWTGRGFDGGLEISQGMFPNGVTINSGEKRLPILRSGQRLSWSAGSPDLW